MLYSLEDVTYEQLPIPQKETPSFVELTDRTMEDRKKNILIKMAENNLDVLAIYADLEHGQNFEYLTGFIPRFEEGLLILYQNGEAYCLLGNETMRMEAYTRLPFKAILTPYFSLPNQPFDVEESLAELLKKADVTADMRVGLVGWKLFNDKIKKHYLMSDMPGFIIDAWKEVVDNPLQLVNATGLFVHPDKGVRTVNNANEMAHYAYGQVLASNGILAGYDALEIGEKELAIAECLESQGQRNTVVTICSTGERFKNANVYPGIQKVELGDRFSMTVGYKGGLVSRAGYAVYDEKEIKGNEKNYLHYVAKPYFSAVATWLSTIRIGMTGGKLYEQIEQVVPKAKYGWHLNPGHLVADEEWLSSPIYPASEISLKSGMLIQLDLILSVPNYSTANAENGIALADEQLRNEIKKNYPDIWQQIMKRRQFIQEKIGIQLSEEILPLSNTVAYFVPLMLNKKYGLKIRQ